MVQILFLSLFSLFWTIGQIAVSQCQFMVCAFYYSRNFQYNVRMLMIVISEIAENRDSFKSSYKQWWN